MRVRNKNKERSDVRKRNHRKNNYSNFKMRLVKQNLLVVKKKEEEQRQKLKQRLVN